MTGAWVLLLVWAYAHDGSRDPYAWQVPTAVHGFATEDACRRVFVSLGSMQEATRQFHRGRPILVWRDCVPTGTAP